MSIGIDARVRTRSSTILSGPVPHWSWVVQGTTQHGYPNPTYGSGSSSVILGSEAETTEDYPHPRFRSRIEAGDIINSPFRRVKSRIEKSPAGTFEHVYYKANGLTCSQHSPSQVHNLYYKYGGYWMPTYPAILWPDAGWRASVRDSVIGIATTQAFANIDTSEMMALATVAEARKTVDSMRAISLRAYKILRNVRKLRFAELAKEISPKEVADRYMEMRYAIRPLIYDARGVVRALEKARGYTRKTFRGYADDSRSGGDTVIGTGSNLRYLCQGDWKRDWTYEVSAKAGVLCDVTVTDVNVWGGTQLAETLWELVPFSFIADWFANTGDWIAAHTPNAGCNQRASWVTCKETIRSTTSLINARSIANTAGFVNVSLSMPTCTQVQEELVLERFVNVGASTLPTFTMNLDGYKLTDLGIILRKVLS